jgi:hypothetical protein
MNSYEPTHYLLPPVHLWRRSILFSGLRADEYRPITSRNMIEVAGARLGRFGVVRGYMSSGPGSLRRHQAHPRRVNNFPRPLDLRHVGTVHDHSRPQSGQQNAKEEKIQRTASVGVRPGSCKRLLIEAMIVGRVQCVALPAARAESRHMPVQPTLWLSAVTIHDDAVTADADEPINVYAAS